MKGEILYEYIQTGEKHCRKAIYELDCILYKLMIVDNSYT